MLDTLALARSLHPGQRNSLDALCKRYSVDNTKRELHGALLDAGHPGRRLSRDDRRAERAGARRRRRDATRPRTAAADVAKARAPGIALAVPAAIAENCARHEAMLDLIQKASGGKAVWRAS